MIWLSYTPGASADEPLHTDAGLLPEDPQPISAGNKRKDRLLNEVGIFYASLMPCACMAWGLRPHVKHLYYYAADPLWHHQCGGGRSHDGGLLQAHISGAPSLMPHSGLVPRRTGPMAINKPKKMLRCPLQDDLYTPYLGQLAKLAFLASAIHQAVFTIFSTLPFAVGQVRGTRCPPYALSPACTGHNLPHPPCRPAFL